MFEPYELETAPVAPDLPGSVLLRNSLDDAIAAAAADVMLQAQACVRAFEAFHLAITPSLSSRELVLRLMTDPNFRDLPWSRTHLWAAHEPRTVTDESTESSGHLADMILHASDLPRDQWHPAPAHLPDGDARYEQELVGHLERREPGHDRLDCVVLPAHTGSIRGLDDPLDRLVGPTEDGNAIALTRRAVRGGRLVMVVAPGGSARATLADLAADPSGIGIQPVGGQLRWYIDRLACGHENLE